MEYGPSVFGVSVREGSAASYRWGITGHQGGMYTAGMRGQITGRRANIFLMDDVVKDDKDARSPKLRKENYEWYQSVLYTRLEPDAKVIFVTTRWHPEDLAGLILQKAADDGEKWEYVNLPALAKENDPLGRKPGEALWPERFPVEELKRIEIALEAYWWGTMYQNDPTPEGGTEWPKEYFDWPGFWFDDWPKDGSLRVMALDPSKGDESKFGDYQAYVMMQLGKDGLLYIDADLTQGRTVTGMIEAGLEIYRTFKAEAFAIETNLFQQLVQVELERISRDRGMMVATFGLDNRVPKDVRIRRLGPFLHRHGMRFKGGSRGARLLVKQLQDFPAGAYCDGPDSLEMALRLMIELFNGRMNYQPLRLTA